METHVSYGHGLDAKWCQTQFLDVVRSYTPFVFFLSYIMSRVYRLAWDGNLHLLLGACNCHCCLLFAHVASAESG